MRVERWATPWPPIKIGVDEWIIIRDTIRFPAAIIRRLEFPDGTTQFRVVTWAELSADRVLVGYCRDLELADMSVRFSQPAVKPKTPWTKGGLTAQDWDHNGPPQAHW